MIRLLLRYKKQIGQLNKSASLRLDRNFSKKAVGSWKGSGDDREEETESRSVADKLVDATESVAKWVNRRRYGKDTDCSAWDEHGPIVPLHCDVLVIGGGVMGSSVAYWLKSTVFNELNIVVIEKDPTYYKASTTLSVGGLRQQFSLRENIEMSLFGAEFLQNVDEHLGLPGEPPVDVCFHPYGYLVLASEAGAEILQANSQLQNSLGAKNILLTANRLKSLFPWINPDGLALGCLGLEKEGWFDPWSLLCAFKRKAEALGVMYVHGEAKGFLYEPLTRTAEEEGKVLTVITKRPEKLLVETPDGNTREIQFSNVVIAAGAFSGQVAKLAGIGTGTGIMRHPLPVEPRKRYVYCVHCPDGPGINTPMTIDPSGTYFRRDGLAGNYICGKSPNLQEEPSVDDLSVDHEYFDEKIWPVLAHRVRAFECLKVQSSWAGYYEYNTFDKNGIIGVHPFHENVYFATGFSGHGIQQAAAVGRAVKELILDGRFTTIDLSKFGFDRLINREPMLEMNVF